MCRKGRTTAARHAIPSWLEAALGGGRIQWHPIDSTTDPAMLQALSSMSPRFGGVPPEGPWPRALDQSSGCHDRL